MLEACGPMGVVHGGEHEKTDLAEWSATQQQLLSLCFCASCQTLMLRAALDPARLAELVGDAVRRDAASVEQALGRERADAVRAIRTGLSRDLRRRLVTEIGPGLRVILHASADPWATGSFATVAPSVDADVDVLVGSCWSAGVRELDGLAAVCGPAALGAYVRPDVAPPDLRAAGVTELHLYHLGLASAAGLRRLADLVATFSAAG